jgi:AraC-like DNA-binding protein
MTTERIRYPATTSLSRSAPPATGAVATFLTPIERQRVDAAGHGCYHALHRESLDELLVDLRTRSVSAVLVSVARYQSQHAPQVARLVREFPRVPAVALLTISEPSTTQALLALGQHGVRSLVDARDPKGWRDLRQLVSGETAGAFEQEAVTRLRADLAHAPADCWRFFEALFLAPASLSTVQQIARANNVVPSTFMSRFFRVKLPTPKKYLAMARLVRAARLFENPGMSVTHVANHLEYSSPQSFSRHVRQLMQCTPMDFRRQFDGDRMLTTFREQLVLPYLDILQQFEPFAITPRWSVLRESRRVESAPALATARRATTTG